MEVKGKLEFILPVESGTSKAGKEWSSQSIVVNTGEQYNPQICIKFFGDKADMIQNHKVGDSIEVGVNISSREFNEKWYHSIDGWKINGADTTEAIPAQEQGDDLPF